MFLKLLLLQNEEGFHASWFEGFGTRYFRYKCNTTKWLTPTSPIAYNTQEKDFILAILHLQIIDDRISTFVVDKFQISNQ